MSPQAVLKDRRGDVLASGSDQELLLATGDPQEPIVVQLSDVARMEPPVHDSVVGRVLVVEVGRENAVSLDQDLSVVGDLDGDPRKGRTHGADLDRLSVV